MKSFLEIFAKEIPVIDDEKLKAMYYDNELQMNIKTENGKLPFYCTSKTAGAKTKKGTTTVFTDKREGK
jgi:hypothetical protein